MRLKFLFFPIIIIISLYIFIGYIWPEIANLKVANEEKLSHEQAIKAIKDKQTAIQTIDAQINSDSEGESVVNSYLPNKKMEERILTGINYLATDSQVSLVSLSLSSGAEEVSNDDATTLSVSPLANIANSLQGVQNKLPETSKSGTETINTSISVVGEYDKINLFLDQLQKISMFHSIKSLTITSSNAGDKVENASDGTVDTENNPAAASTLSADLVVDFGWMGTASIDNQKMSKFQSGIDKETMATIKQYISQKAPSVDKAGDMNGKINPFLP
ncbi:MAG: hypothetical protein ACD_56C00110G0004 [uncultured bacterium]|nr:MAG: hypothetical protein ACD_56C00110G0004 [uncultured bacterium]